MRAKKTALLCWEAGSGHGHAVALVGIARELQRRGWKAVVAVPGGSLPSGVQSSGVEICEAPRWGEGAPTLSPLTKSTATFGDTLAEIGLRSTEWVRQQIEAWRSLFTLHRPDVAVADYAPGAILAARGRVPSVACGVGFTVPPKGLRHFPLLRDGAPAVYREAATCDSVNEALMRLDAPTIAFLSDAVAGDARCVLTLPMLDPYDALRTEPVLGPQLGAPITRRSNAGSEVFCYLREASESNRLDELSGCLIGLPVPVVAFLPGLSAAAAARLRGEGVQVLDAPAPLATQLERSRLAVHFGGHGIAAASLLAGVPQVVLGFDIEKTIIADALVRRGVARDFDYYLASPGSIREGILQALGDERQLAAAESAARENERYCGRDVTSEIAMTCIRISA